MLNLYLNNNFYLIQDFSELLMSNKINFPLNKPPLKVAELSLCQWELILNKKSIVLKKGGFNFPKELLWKWNGY